MLSSLILALGLSASPAEVAPVEVSLAPTISYEQVRRGSRQRLDSVNTDNSRRGSRQRFDSVDTDNYSRGSRQR